MDEPSDTQVLLKVAFSGARPARPTFFDGTLMEDNLWSIVQSCWAQKPSQRPDVDRLVTDMSAILWSALDLD